MGLWEKRRWKKFFSYCERFNLNDKKIIKKFNPEKKIYKVKLYLDSQGLYGTSPFLYPIYGLGGIP